MPVANPTTLTINAVPNTLNKVSTLANGSVYQSADGNVKMTISNAYGKRTRRTVRVDFRKIAPDPLISSTNIQYSMSFYFVVDVPIVGFTIVEAKQVMDGLIATLNATSGALMTQILGGEN